MFKPQLNSTNTPILKLVQEYQDEATVPDITNIEWVLSASETYINRMPDSQTRVLMHLLVEHIKDTELL